MKKSIGQCSLQELRAFLEEGVIDRIEYRTYVRRLFKIPDTKSPYDLVGWDAISGWLSVDRKTAKRWTKGQGLPVVTLNGRARADSVELTKWIKQHEPKDGAESTNESQ